ncbi:MAG TPA: NAD(P)H-binding protein [Terriglobia bacterium]|nr:NAD(P)H-binding protein [Terriglobia bacterium]
MYAIVGASGNTGSTIAGKLLASGKKVRVIGRDPARLEGLVQKGAEAFVANADNAAALTQAFAGTKAVYLMIPPSPAHPDVRGEQERVSDAALAAVEDAGVEYAVVLSSIGADKPDKTGPVVGLHNLEQKLNGARALKAVYLRAGYFMENLLPQAGIIKSFGVMGGPLRGDLKVGMIATQDIGAWAAEALLKLDFTGKQARELLGQRDLDYREAAAVIGNAVGKPGLSYVQFPPAQLKPALQQIGMSANMADLLLEMSDALNSGYMAPLETRSAKNTTPTSLETFVAQAFVPRFTGKNGSA